MQKLELRFYFFFRVAAFLMLGLLQELRAGGISWSSGAGTCAAFIFPSRVCFERSWRQKASCGLFLSVQICRHKNMNT